MKKNEREGERQRQRGKDIYIYIYIYIYKLAKIDKHARWCEENELDIDIEKDK